ncbi:MAG: pilus assembly protein [Candidatus Dactylopiibacterium carminicum]|uniref:Pilus assembly protein n=1 Tax=Candidatus Dactylopiibacterium carminicum TaxID=857335 RepID=A0A272ENL6_9RHOO|nr:PilC/PilY family type IV pilus protein [Candidatus Dactylopiibacterium carminicum]KAF7599126.1 pilus assembly protein [Candidatus Dactylopiibacterium carminicum]PAS91691.1 MAG: pilus assembly protein [Candidatus Dactylopiibacterium carminicum]
MTNRMHLHPISLIVIMLYGCTLHSAASASEISLADSPLFSSVSVPGNLALALSVEYPTATTPAYTTSYSSNTTYLGYFDSNKCYTYQYNSTNAEASYFKPNRAATNRTCPAATTTLQLWSGNYLNWASMQTLDTFRWILTGGYRSVDNTTQTILTKTYAWYNGLNDNKSISSGVSTATPFNWSSSHTRVRSLGTAMYIAATSGTLGGSTIVNYNGHNNAVSNTNTKWAKSNSIYRVYINIEVCASSTLKESNCVAYGSNFKPEGLMQQYSKQLRYAAFGYYNQDGNDRDGGVLRAPMKFIGPTSTIPGSAAIANPNSEWDPSTGIMHINPNPEDVAATINAAAAEGFTVTVENSGVMNYLNKFGYYSQRYKSNDPVSELYYAVSRYLRNKGNVPAYTSLAGAGSNANANTYLDNFPALRTWQDPIQYACQKNFILGIGDVYAHYDRNLPGAKSDLLSSTESSTVRTFIESDDLSTIGEYASTPDGKIKNVAQAANAIGRLEGNSYYGDWRSPTCRVGTNGVYIASVAYDMNVRDIRPDLADKQTVSTYWMDVHENNKYCHKNQYWMAAKYGGFKVPEDFDPYSINLSTDSLTAESWRTNTDTLPFPGTNFEGSGTYSFTTDTNDSKDPRPDNYFPGNSPETMRSGLISAFAKIAAEAAAATGTALASPSPQKTETGSGNYQSTYDPDGWTGTLKGQRITYNSSGAPVLTTIWEAGALLNARAWSTRKIITYCDGDGIPLSSGMSCAASLAAVDGISTANQSASNYVNYLRGDRSQEVANGGAYRTRESRLGDIVNAKPVALGAPDFPWSDLYNQGYGEFKRNHSNRPTVVFAGANDGMLHAFNGSLTAIDKGQELFSYIPGLIYSDTDSATGGGLSSLGNPSFTHRFLVDGSPYVADIDFQKTPNATATTTDWRSILIGGLGKGGKGYYAIDVTDPTDWTSENSIADKILWEFSHTHLGYSYGVASVVKTAKYGWVVVLTSGYNNDDGKGYFFFVNPRTGELLEMVATSEGSTASPLNMAHATAYTPNYRDGTADAIYAADLQGNVWRLDVTASSGDYLAPTKIASLSSPSGGFQPVTTRPLVEAEPSSGKRYVLVGTGRLLADSDISTNQKQSFYAIIDGQKAFGAFYGGSISLPENSSFPVSRNNLEANTDLLSGIGSSPTNSMGWYYDMPLTNQIAERVTINPEANNGIIAWAGNLPDGDACSPAGTGKAYAVSLGLGRSVLRNSSGIRVASLGISSMVTDLAFGNLGGKIRLDAGGAGGEVENLDGDFASGTRLKRLNWRMVPTAD